MDFHPSKFNGKFSEKYVDITKERAKHPPRTDSSLQSQLNLGDKIIY
jgi:hypothetical protein